LSIYDLVGLKGKVNFGILAGFGLYAVLLSGLFFGAVVASLRRAFRGLVASLKGVESPNRLEVGRLES
jgi:hypothetical protein